MTSSDRFWIRAAVVVTVAAFMSACASSPRFAGRTDRPSSTPRESSSPASKPSPSGRVLLTLEGLASYYAHDFHGRKTSNGEVYDMNGYTAAHRNLPFGTKILVTNLENDKTLVVRVNDRGPFHEDRIIDLSLGAARELGFQQRGTARVRLDVVEWGDGK